MAKHCLIVSGGDFAPLSTDVPDPSCIIACDRGYLHAARMGHSPDLIIGDFDSAPEPDTGIPVIRVPSRKDDTDTMLAARRALADGYEDITIACAFGGRLDHTLANLATGAFIAENGGRTRLVGNDTEAFIFRGGRIRLKRRPGWSLSVFSLSDECTGLSLVGTKYDCKDITITNRFPIGVSNSWSAEEADISVRSGIILVMESKLKDNEHI